MTASKRWLRRGRAAFLTVAAAAALWAATGRAADKSDEAPKAAASEMDAIPNDGVAVVSFHFAELWNSEAFKASREKLMNEPPYRSDALVKQFGVAPDEIDRVTGLMQSIDSRDNWLVFVTTTKPYDSKKVLAAAAPDATEEKANGRVFHVNPKGHDVAFLTDRTYALGSTEEIKRLLNHAKETKDGPLTPALLAAEKHLIAAGADVQTIGETAPKEMPPQMAAFTPLLKAQSAVLTTDLDEVLKAEGKLTFAGESDAKAGETAVNAALDIARGGLVMGLQELSKQKEMGRFIALLKEVQTGVRAAKVELKGSSVAASATVKVDLRKAAPDLVEAVQKVRVSAARMSSVNNLKQLALAMYNYESTYGYFPAAAVYDKNGKPLLSWRVMILPYIEQDALYKEFHLDEPWDSDHNKKLLEKMPPLFGTGADQAVANHETHYQTLVGKGTIFDGKKGLKVTDITDGTSNTLMVVEAKTPVPWTKPDDVPFDAGKMVPKLGGLFDGIFNAAFADGSVRSLPLTIKEEKLRALVTRNGGEVIDFDK
jgi:Protein of unknown function (DUF1559)